MKEMFVKTLLSRGKLFSSNNTSLGKDGGVLDFEYPKGKSC